MPRGIKIFLKQIFLADKARRKKFRQPKRGRGGRGGVGGIPPRPSVKIRSPDFRQKKFGF